MTTANVAIATAAPAAFAESPRKPRPTVMDIITTFDDALRAAHHYETLVGKGVDPGTAARRASGMA